MSQNIKRNMHRRTILMPADLIAKMIAIARKRKTSFSAVVREAVTVYIDNQLSADPLELEDQTHARIENLNQAAQRRYLIDQLRRHKIKLPPEFAFNRDEANKR